MEADGQFDIVRRDKQGEGTPVAKFRELKVRMKKEGSVWLGHTGVVGKDYFSSELEAVLLQMKEGDSWTVKASNGDSYEIQISEVGKEVDARQGVDLAQAYKAEGNAFIKTKQYGKAVEKYKQAYDLVVNHPDPKGQELKLSIISNLALATLNFSEFRQSVRWCDEHLDQTLQPNLKVLYRRASARKGIRDWAEARNDIELGIAQSGEDADSVKNFKSLLAVLEKEQKEQSKKERQVYGKMFG